MFSRRKSAPILPACPNVLTPDSIPTFFIPPNLATLQGRRSQRNKSHGDQEGSLVSVANHQHIIQVESSDQEEGRLVNCLHNASSMPQLSSPAGLPYLPESPHTRRRESLFHDECLPCHFHGARFSSLPSRPLSQLGIALDSDTASSTETSPYSSPLPVRSPGGLLPCQTYGHRPRFMSHSANISTIARPSSLSAEETSSTDTSPSFPRREREPGWGSPAALNTLPIFPLNFIRCHERLTKEVILNLSKGGRLRLSTEYLQSQGRLRIRLISAEAFYQPQCDPRHISCCVSLHLRPGAMQRQRSAVIKRSCNPIFNEDFFFEGLSPGEMPRHSLRFKVLNKGSGVRRDTVLAECNVPLDSLLP